MVEQYQTRWVRGKADGNGVRECADRYEIIKSIAKQFNRPFTVLDIGANLGYFSFRLMEDFENCHAVMVEGHPTYARQLTELAGINGQGIVLTKSLTQGDLALLGDVEHFDLVLAMSVVHHVNGDVNRTCRLIENLGDNVIFEMPTENNACGQRLVQSWEIGEDWERLGEGKSHLDGGVRPIFLSQQYRTRLGQKYIGCPKHLKPQLKIISDWDSKEVMFMDGKEPRREWLPGINLHTWKYFNGTKPVPSLILDDVRKLLGEHGDVRPWNVIVSSNAATLIDCFQAPTLCRREHGSLGLPETDDVSFEKLEKWFAGRSWPFDDWFRLDDDDEMDQLRAELAGQTKAISERYSRMVADMDRAIENDPANADYFHRRASMCFNQQQYDKAITDWSNAIRLAPSIGMYYEHRGYALKTSGHDDEAAKDFDKASELGVHLAKNDRPSTP